MEFHRPRTLKNVLTHYCPGCGHGIVHRLVAEAIDELGIRERTIGTAPVGCAVLFYNYFDCDIIECAHGRPPAVATGMKRMLPDRIVFTYQGDGDLAAIGTTETIHAANRGENITVIFVNNAIYGMTSGQMAPTTLLGQKTATSPRGRTAEEMGYPIKMCELLATLEGPAYLTRVSTHDSRHVLQAGRAIKKAFEMQQQKKGFALVEVLSTCSVNWGMTPVDALKWVEQNMVPYYPLGVYKDVTAKEGN